MINENPCSLLKWYLAFHVFSTCWMAWKRLRRCIRGSGVAFCDQRRSSIKLEYSPSSEQQANHNQNKNNNLNLKYCIKYSIEKRKRDFSLIEQVFFQTQTNTTHTYSQLQTYSHISCETFVESTLSNNFDHPWFTSNLKTSRSPVLLCTRVHPLTFSTCFSLAKVHTAKWKGILSPITYLTGTEHKSTLHLPTAFTLPHSKHWKMCHPGEHIHEYE